LVLFVLNGMIYQKEKILKSGRTVFLELAPVDPRSLMQGDYMALRYKITDAACKECEKVGSIKGKLVLRDDKNGVCTFIRVYKGESTSPGEYLLNYRLLTNRQGRSFDFFQNQMMLRLGAEAFFFQEGKADVYAKAKYGELKVSSSGESVLVGLRDSAFTPLGK